MVANEQYLRGDINQTPLKMLGTVSKEYTAYLYGQLVLSQEHRNTYCPMWFLKKIREGTASSMILINVKL